MSSDRTAKSRPGHGSRRVRRCGPWRAASPNWRPPRGEVTAARGAGGPGPDGPLGWQRLRRRPRPRRRAHRRGASPSSAAPPRIGGAEAVLISFEFGYPGRLARRAHRRPAGGGVRARPRRTACPSGLADRDRRQPDAGGHASRSSQLQRVARESALTRAAGLPQLAVLRDPTTGGGWATLGAGADVVLALPGAQVGFAGSRVRPPDADPRRTRPRGSSPPGTSTRSWKKGSWPAHWGGG